MGESVADGGQTDGGERPPTVHFLPTKDEWNKTKENVQTKKSGMSAPF